MTPANKGPFQRRLQAQQESLWMGICLKCYQNQDHSCGSTKLSLITVPWLHLGSHVNLEKQKERRRGVEERSDLFSAAHVQWQSSSFLCVDHPPAHGGGHIFTSAGKLSLTVCRKTIRAQSPCVFYPPTNSQHILHNSLEFHFKLSTFTILKSIFIIIIISRSSGGSNSRSTVVIGAY